MIAPLRKRYSDGTPYKRTPQIEGKLVQLASLSRVELVERCKISGRSHSDYVPSECLVHFVRACKTDASQAWFEQLYRILQERILRGLPRGSTDGRTDSLTGSTIRQKAADRFIDMLVRDRSEYVETLDYFEIRFDGALANLRRDAQEQAWRHENRSMPLELDEDTRELAPEVELAAAGFDLFKVTEISGEDYRLRLDAAIDRLPTEQRRVIEMIRLGIPIDSEDTEATTIRKVLGRSEKTIRNYRDKAYASLREVLLEDE